MTRFSDLSSIWASNHYSRPSRTPSQKHKPSRRCIAARCVSTSENDVVQKIIIEGRFMKLPRRSFLHLAAGAAALPAVSRIAKAQTYPTRPVRLVDGYPAGGSADILARLMGK